LVVLMVSFLLAFPSITYMHFSPFVLLALSISFSLTWSVWFYLAKSTSHEAPRYAAFYNLMSLCLFSTQIIVLNTRSPCPSLNFRDQVSHLCRTAGKDVGLYILIFTILDSRREDKVLNRVSKRYPNSVFF
jgi:hypothetical protein